MPLGRPRWFGGTLHFCEKLYVGFRLKILAQNSASIYFPVQYGIKSNIDIESAVVILVKSWCWRFQVDRIEILVTRLAWRNLRGGSSTVNVTDHYSQICHQHHQLVISTFLFQCPSPTSLCYYLTSIQGPKTGSFQEWDYIQHHSCILRILLIEFSFTHLQFSSSLAMNYLNFSHWGRV